MIDIFYTPVCYTFHISLLFSNVTINTEFHWCAGTLSSISISHYHMVQIRTEKKLYDYLILYPWCHISNTAATFSPIKPQTFCCYWKDEELWLNNADIAMSWWILRITKQFIIYFLVVFNSSRAPFRFLFHPRHEIKSFIWWKTRNCWNHCNYTLLICLSVTFEYVLLPK